MLREALREAEAAPPAARTLPPRRLSKRHRLTSHHHPLHRRRRIGPRWRDGQSLRQYGACAQRHRRRR